MVQRWEAVACDARHPGIERGTYVCMASCSWREKEEACRLWWYEDDCLVLYTCTNPRHPPFHRKKRLHTKKEISTWGIRSYGKITCKIFLRFGRSEAKGTETALDCNTAGSNLDLRNPANVHTVCKVIITDRRSKHCINT